MAVKVTAAVVVYGSRWPLLKQVADACLADPQFVKFVITDNGCKDAAAMDAYAAQYGSRVTILRQDRNLGFGPAMTKALEYARTTDCDYVFVLDDDSVPEHGAIDHFMNNLRLFPDEKVILVANRIDVPGNKDIFTTRPLQEQMPRGTLFEVFSVRKIWNATKLFLGIKPRTDHPFLPVVPTEAFVTGGTFLPIKVVREEPLLDTSFFIYGEDLEYAWRIRRKGYRSYACARPIIRDIDMTFPTYGAHIWGLFDPKTPTYKVYFRMRNSVIISKRHTVQSRPVLVLNIIGWFIGLALFGLLKTGPRKIYFERIVLVARALYAGYRGKMELPPEVVTPA